jgi:ABC-type multidrug transport system fused ATPase/permease subunit
MRAFFQLLVEFKRLLDAASASPLHLTVIALSYLIITSFDLLGLGVFFVFLNSYFSGDSLSSVIGFFDYEFELLWLLVSMPVIWTVKFFAVLSANFQVIRFGQNAISSIRLKIIKGLFEKKFPSNIIREKGLWVDTLNRQLSFAGSSVIEPALRGFFDSCLLIACILYVGIFAPNVFLVLITWLLLGIALFDKLIRKKINADSSNFNKLSELLADDLILIADGITEFWSIRSIRFFDSRMQGRAELMIRKYSTFATLTMAPRLFTEALLVTGVILAMWFAEISDFDRDQIFLSLGVIGVGAFRIIPLLNSASLGINQLRSGRRTIENVNLLVKGLSDGEPKKTLMSPPVAMHVRNLTKNFKTNQIFKNLNFTIHKGEITAIIGPSGLGKTTLAEILSSFMKPDLGIVVVETENGERYPLYQVDLPIGFVSQTPMIFDGTIAENILLNDPDDNSFKQNDKRLKNALRLSGFQLVLDNLPEGLNTLIGTNGRKLSGGQRQKLSICRALYLSKGIVIFDEPTSAFDKKSELFFFDSLKEIKKSHIVIIVTHSTNYLNVFDNVINFEERGNVKIRIPRDLGAD